MKKQVKPIVTVDLNIYTHNERGEDILKQLESTVGKDYHIILYSYEGIKAPEFQVFYEKDFNEVKYEELKEFIKKRNGKKINSQTFKIKQKWNK